MTVVVWVLVLFTSSPHYNDSVAIIDNISSQHNCYALERMLIRDNDNIRSVKCYAVRKVK